MCGVGGKFRRLTVVGYHYVNNEKNPTSIIEAPKIEPIMSINIGGLVPE